MTIGGAQLSALFGTTTTTVAADPASAVALLKRVTASGAQAKGVAAEQKDPAVVTAVAQFKQALAQARDLKSALGDPRVLNVLLPALGLADQVGFPGMAQKALTADPSATTGLLSHVDSRWKAAAKTLGLYGKDVSALKDAGLQQTLIGNYVAYHYQKGLDAKSPGMSDAIYFIQNAKGVTDGNVYNLLGNAILRRVATGALGLPQELAVQTVEAQADAITRRMPVSELKDPAQVYKIAQRYLMAQATSAAASSAPAASLSSLAVSLRR